LVAHTVLPSVRPAQPVAPAALQLVQAFATQKPLAGFEVHWLSAAHSTHWPAEVPLVEHTILPSMRAAQPVAPAVLQPVHTFATQKPLAGSEVHWLSAAHSTHWPEDAPLLAHTVLPSVRTAHPAALHPVQAFATQNPLAGSFVHWLSVAHSTH
jgi:hypothetical protein